MDSGVTVKGSGIAPTMKYIREHHGDDAAERIFAALPPDVRQALRSPLASRWYPVEYVGELMKAIQAHMGSDDDTLFAISRDSAKSAFSMIYKVFFKLGSPAFIIGRVSSVWGMLCSAGHLSVPEKDNKRLLIRLTGFPYRNPAYCGIRLRGWFHAALEVSGCDITRGEHTMCACNGAPHCEWVFEWR